MDIGLQTPLELFYHWEKEIPQETFLRQPIAGEWHLWSWEKAGKEIRSMAAALQAMNLPKGSRVGILSKNCAHWIMADLAIMMAGHVSVPLYPNISAKTVEKILQHSETSVLFVGKLDNYEAMRSGVPSEIRCISFPYQTYAGYDTWNDVIAKHAPLAHSPNRNLDELMTIIYTSGTTGEPKGVMHNFRNLSFSIIYAMKQLPELQRVKLRFFSYLPLSHIAERMVVEMAGIYSGGVLSFAESLDLFVKNLQETEPNVFLAVPRIWTKFQMGILGKMPQWKLNLFLSIPILSGIVKKKIRKGLGLAKAKYLLTGAAPISENLLRWYDKLGMSIQEAYAMTENSAYSHISLPGKVKFGYVGQALEGNEVRISPEGEVQVRCVSVTQGYYKSPALTKECITEDGFLRTGDMGEIDEQGYLKLTGRLKELFKTEKGKFVAPSPIELDLSENTFIEQVVVVGHNIPQPIALIVLSEQAKNSSRKEIMESIADTVQKVNATNDAHEHLRTVVLVKDAWTIENNLMTPTLKIKRNEIDAKYSSRYPLWYSNKETVIWE